MKRLLAARSLTDGEILPYVIAHGATYGLALAFPPENPNGWDTLLGLIAVPAEALGVLWVYRQNGGHVGRDFLQRYLAVGWVVMVRMLAAVLVAGTVMSIMAGIMTAMIWGPPPEETLQTTPFVVWFGVALSVVYFERVAAHVRQVARGLPNSPSKPTSGMPVATSGE